MVSLFILFIIRRNAILESVTRCGLKGNRNQSQGYRPGLRLKGPRRAKNEIESLI